MHFQWIRTAQGPGPRNVNSFRNKTDWLLKSEPTERDTKSQTEGENKILRKSEQTATFTPNI